MKDCLELFAPFEVIFVAVRRPLEELLRRERARGDRSAGTAAAQYEVAHAHDDRDIEVDTGAHTAAQCARQIVAEIARLPQDKARSGIVASASRTSFGAAAGSGSGSHVTTSSFLRPRCRIVRRCGSE